MSLSTRISRIFMHCGISPEEEKLIEPDRCQRDLAAIKLISCLGLAILALALLASFFIPYLRGNTNVYLSFSILFAAEALIAAHARPEVSKHFVVILGMVSLATMLAVGIFLGTYSSEEYLAVTYVAILLVAPSLYCMPLRHSFTFSLISVVIFNVICFQVKPEDLFFTDLVDSVAFLIIGTVLGYFHVHTRLTSMIYARKVSIMSVTDALTGLKNRAAFTQDMTNLDAPGAVPRDLSIISIDVNGLKTVNDTLLHEAGDELLRGAATCMKEAFARSEVYRLGGDEFAVISCETEAQTAERIRTLRELSNTWRGQMVKGLSLAVGVTSHAEMPDATCADLLKEADRRMYEDKAAYYSRTGHDRRAR